MKKILNASVALFFFKPYTDMSRPLEVWYGVLAWVGMVIMTYGIIMKIWGD